jgi:hypothetical protein
MQDTDRDYTEKYKKPSHKPPLRCDAVPSRGSHHGLTKFFASVALTCAFRPKLGLSYDELREVRMKQKKKFDVVKHVKRLSRVMAKAPKGRIVRSKKEILLNKIAEREIRELD